MDSEESESAFERVARKLRADGHDVTVMTDENGDEYIVENDGSVASLYVNDDSIAETVYAVVCADEWTGEPAYEGVSAVFFSEDLAVEYCDLMVENAEPDVFDIEEAPLFS